MSAFPLSTVQAKKEMADMIIREKWMKDVREWYLNQDFSIIFRDGEHIKMPRDEAEALIKIGPSDKVAIDKKTDEITIKTGKNKGTYTKSQVLLVDEYIISLKRPIHPIQKMWLGYQNGLKYYINCCIDELLTRKNKDGSFCKMRIPKYDLPPSHTICRPWWTQCPYFLLAFRCSLLRKEKDRNEPPWYINIFKKYTKHKMYKHGYIWPSKQTQDNLLLMMTGKRCKLSEICAPPTEDV